MKRKKVELMASKIPSRKPTIPAHHGETKEKWPLSLSNAVCRWVAAMSICLAIWAVLSPLFYEQFYNAAARTGDFKGWLFALACVLFPLLLVSVTSTRQVIVETRKQYSPPTNTNNAGLPAHQTLVRASSEPLQTQEAVLLRAAAEGIETPPEELMRASVGQE